VYEILFKGSNGGRWEPMDEDEFLRRVCTFNASMRFWKSLNEGKIVKTPTAFIRRRSDHPGEFQVDTES
jgi:hypothetical protein